MRISIKIFALSSFLICCLFSCTPTTEIAENSSSDTFATGGDSSAHPDNDRDEEDEN
ncbi:hypothetical protein Q4566_16890 [Tamlana sp. 2_MG-2023]|uniref:hypothetical protein n=1 Tax=unclassified Tamlana TaxID=2614803 RepID=UPI0026E23FC3|nr:MULTISPECIES: hypothetical protein [unclassified Tamlana]MDO6761886.1 hypothetical protein [Tamlana sp. 2_MG-2023]MDO6792648.1 hypothetical protein [Tamlana sp. 1_MG-2023]